MSGTAFTAQATPHQVQRIEPSLITHWWMSLDRLLLTAVISLIGFGVLMIAAASPPVAVRIGLGEWHFLKRHLVLLVPAIAAMVMISYLGQKGVRRAGLALFCAMLVALILTPLIAEPIKGATRWIQVAGFSLQASEFMKPAFAIVAAFLFAQHHKEPGFPGYALATGLYLVVISLLLLQPDLGQTVVVSAVWFVQFFLAGLPLLLVAGLAVAGVGGLIGAYLVLPHVKSRIDRFLDPSSGDTYQIERSLAAFREGGLFGRGPSDGTIKHTLPDAHSDFIFAVLGEEMGLIACLALIMLFAFIVARALRRAWRQPDLFPLLAVSGLMAQFGLQAVIHMASALHLIPTKGMTLPFISYGGSSLLALAIGMGFVLALTRERRIRAVYMDLEDTVPVPHYGRVS